MMDGRTSQRLRQEAWKRLSQEWKDDPEACFVFGFQAGLDAVAPRVEPPVTESGAGFESLPASVQEPDPCPGCARGHVCRTPSCGRLKLPLDHPYRANNGSAS
jgi:hypothetical protein